MPHLFSCGSSENPDPEKAIQETAQKICEGLGGARCDLAFLFISEGFQESGTASWVRAFRDAVSPVQLVGCNSSGVISGGREIELTPAVSAVGMHLDGVRIQPFVLTPKEIHTFGETRGLVEELDLYPNEQPHFIAFGDPVSCDVRRLLSSFNAGYPGSPLTGGMASAVTLQAPSSLWVGSETVSSGLVGLALSGNIECLTLVSQGCRPVGTPLAITHAEDNVLFQIAGRPALEVLRETYQSLPPEDQEIAKTSLFVGLAMDESAERFVRGDFLIRNIMGADNEKGSLAIGEMLEPGQTIQFQLRDQRASSEDLEAMLKRLPRLDTARAEGGLLVSCLGRGRGLFGEPDHDAGMIQALRGPLPLAGFFANGEFGPVRNKNFIHGYTSSLTLFREKISTPPDRGSL